MKFLHPVFGILCLCLIACSQAAISLRCKSHCEGNEETDYMIKGKPYACNCEVVKTNGTAKPIHKRSTSDETNEESSEPKTFNIFKLRSRNLEPGKHFNFLDLSTKSPLLEKIREKLDEFKLAPNSEENILGGSLLDYKLNPISLPPLEDILQKHAELVSPHTDVLENIRSHVDNWKEHLGKAHAQFTPQLPSFSDLEEHVNKINLNMRMDNPLLQPNWPLVGGENPLSKIKLFSKFKETENESENDEEESGNVSKHSEEKGGEHDMPVVGDIQLPNQETTTRVCLKSKNEEATTEPVPVSKKPRRKFRMKERISEDGGEGIVIPHMPGIIVQPKEFMGEENP